MTRVVPSLEDVFLDVVDRLERQKGQRRESHVGGGRQGNAADSGATAAVCSFCCSFPCLFLFLYGYALNFDIRHVPLAVEDRDHSEESRALVSAFVRSTYFDRVATIERPEDLDALARTAGPRERCW